MAENHNRQKKIAVINDYTGFGRCSITVALPLISMLKVQCCPLPTSVLSNHTGFESYFLDDYTSRMEPYIGEWKKLGLQFDGISSGFLGSKEQIQIVLRFFEEFRTEHTVILVDPVMGDNGRPYATCTGEMCEEMKRLAARADILTPNLTEACLLTGVPYHEGSWHREELADLAGRLEASGPGKVVITGIKQGGFIANYCCETGKPDVICRTKHTGPCRPGTGDIFSAILAADAVNGVPFSKSVHKAAGFIRLCLEKSMELDLPLTDGVCFEEVLGRLK